MLLSFPEESLCLWRTCLTWELWSCSLGLACAKQKGMKSVNGAVVVLSEVFTLELSSDRNGFAAGDAGVVRTIAK